MVESKSEKKVAPAAKDLSDAVKLVLKDVSIIEDSETLGRSNMASVD